MNWSDAMSVGLTEIDDQHKKLVEILNDLYDSMQEGKDKEHMGEILGRLVDYTVWHFANEEKYFAQFNYADTDAHKAEHVGLLKQVGDFKADFEAGEAKVSLKLMRFLKDWLVNHIQGTDKKYASCFAENGIK